MSDLSVSRDSDSFAQGQPPVGRKLSMLLAAVAAPAAAQSSVDAADFFNSGNISSNNTVGWNNNVLQGSSFDLTLKNGSAQLYKTSNFITASSRRYAVRLGTSAAGQNFQAAITSTFLKTFNASATLGANVTDNQAAFASLAVAGGNRNAYGNTGTVISRYLLFKFTDNAEVYNGWIQVSGYTAWSGTNKYNYVSVSGYAWQKASFGTIQAGVAAVPEPSTLITSGIAALAGGAVALRRWRRERKPATPAA